MKAFSALIALFCLAGTQWCRADFHTNTITTPGGVFAFSVDGSPATNPVINLVAGVTNILIINTASFHPVVITSSINVNDFYSGASPEVVNAQPITVTTPTTGFPTTLFYMCHIHGFHGQINLTGAVVTNFPPAPNTILEVRVGTNIVMISTATNTTSFIFPEFSSNALGGTWTTVPNFTNSFVNGTNITVFDRLDPICGPNVFLRLRYDSTN